MCVCVCLLSIEIQTTGWIAMKFAMEVVLEGRKVRGVNPVPPAPQVLDPKRGCRVPLETQLCILAKTRAPPI